MTLSIGMQRELACHRTIDARKPGRRGLNIFFTTFWQTFRAMLASYLFGWGSESSGRRRLLMTFRNRPLCIALFPLSIAACAHQSAPAATGVSPARVAGSELTRDERVRQALNRLTFGPRPGDAAAVAAMGVEHWIDLQLTPSRIPDDGAEALLARMETQRKQVFELIADHPDPQEFQQRLNQLAAQARANPKLIPIVY